MRIHRTQLADDPRESTPNSLSTEQTSEQAFERLLTPAELARHWALSVDTVRHLFEAEPDVLIFGERRPGRRRYRTLRIPLSVAERVYRRLTTR